MNGSCYIGVVISVGDPLGPSYRQLRRKAYSRSGIRGCAVVRVIEPPKAAELATAVDAD